MIEQLCHEAIQYGFKAVCVEPKWVPLCCAKLPETTLIAAVIGFPDGSCSAAAKVAEAQAASRAGATEIDMVIDTRALWAGDYRRAFLDIAGVVDAVAPVVVKVILETGTLCHDAKIAGCVIAKAAGAGFVKSSTGLLSPGAVAGDIALMRAVVGAEMGVKASGGIRTRDQAQAMLNAGANRIGTSHGVALVSDS